ncbi:unnamed protein product [Heterobilharzia americana]|nr:unnamed protein product [Heterobilharzia americana]
MSGVCDNLVFENPLYTIDQKEILQALADAGLLNNEKLILEVVNQAINFAKTENFNFSHLCALVSVIDRVMKELSSSPYDDMQGVLGVADKMMLSYSIQRPPHCIELFSISGSSKSVEFLVDILFRHWKLYKFALAPTARLVPQIIYDGNSHKPQAVEMKPSGTSILYSILKYALEDQIEATKNKTEIRNS